VRVTATGKKKIVQKKEIRKCDEGLPVDIWADLFEDRLLSLHKLSWIGEVEKEHLRCWLHRWFSPLFKYLASFFQLQLL